VDPTQANNEPERIIRLPEVMNLSGYKQSTLYEMMRQGKFPRPLRLGARAVGWPVSEVRAWQDGLKRTADGVAPAAANNARRGKAA
jgi:prophage regulatory protein